MKFCGAAVLCALPLFASGPYGADNGWAIGNDGTPLMTPEIAAAMVGAGTGWLRVEMRLVPGHTTWDDQMLAFYDVAIDNARTSGLQVILLIDGGSWPGKQADWEANSYETDGGNGCNDYNANYARQALSPIVAHFQGRVKYYELWNEPNAWTQSYGIGGTFLYPSNYACLLAQSWVAIHGNGEFNDVVLFFGGVFGHSIGGHYSYGNAGAQYIDDTYAAGILLGTFTDVLNQYGAYPVDGIGQHIYIDQGGLTTAEHVSQYLDWVRQSYTKYEGSDTRKRTFITEVGWTTRSVSQDVQAQNLVTTLQTFNQTPYVQIGIWFQWKDNPAASLYYGVVDPAGGAKLSLPDYQSYETFEGRNPDGTIFQPILDYFNVAGPAALGNPYDNGITPWVHIWAGGTAQDFAGGLHGDLVVMASASGVYEVNDGHGILSEYSARGGPNSLGYPVDNESPCNAGYCQDFELGSISISAGGTANSRRRDGAARRRGGR